MECRNEAEHGTHITAICHGEIEDVFIPDSVLVAAKSFSWSGEAFAERVEVAMIDGIKVTYTTSGSHL